MKKNFEKRRKIKRNLPKITIFDKKKNLSLLNKRNKEGSNCTEMNCSYQLKKNWIDFLFHCNVKRRQESIH